MTASLPASLLRVLIADPQPVVRQGLAAVLCRYPDFCVVGEAAAAQETLALLSALQPSVLILEIALPDMAEAMNRNANTPDFTMFRRQTYARQYSL